MANEENDFEPFISELTAALNSLGCGFVYLVVDNVSTDSTLALCRELAERDPRFTSVYAPENRNVVDAYIRGLAEAYKAGFRYIIEMDAGMSHDPHAISAFLVKLHEGYSCVFGNRFIPGGSIMSVSLKRRLLSRSGTFVANLLLGTRSSDMTSGFQGFRADVVARLLNYRLLSTAHFYQTELRYLLRHERYAELPISYRAPSPRVSRGAVLNAIKTLLHYFALRITGKPAVIP
ncbi:MAG: glycosyltransferase [Geobacteraceae bacterium]|nr:glycosyltransferase [Geobacteraceae bacterium]